MPELMKDTYYNYNSLYQLALSLKAVYPQFRVDAFVADIMDETWNFLELKARMRKITTALGAHLPPDYPTALGVIDKVVFAFPPEFCSNELIYFPDFVQLYGQNEEYWELSMAAIERYTQSSTGEFAVRPFIIKNEKRMMAQMSAWAKHKNHHVRRLASEGCRPALPWGQGLACFKKNPAPVLSILEQLKDDPSLYVRKSVANNLNDISKTHPDLIVKTAKEWYGKSNHTDWIVKHGCRSLLKAGNREVLDIFGFAPGDKVSVQDFTLKSDAIFIGDILTFSFEVSVKEKAKVRLEYRIDYVKANGKCSPKIFQISEIILNDNQKKHYTKDHSFAALSTRVHYPGTHSITLIVNGTARGSLNFKVLAAK